MAQTLPQLRPHLDCVAVDGFEGPLDLLLRLVELQQLDITVVSLCAVTQQYLAAIHANPTIDHYALAEFVAVGARLLELKSRALLPFPRTAEPAALDPEAGDDLVEMLREYQRFKQVALALQGREQAGLRGFPRLAPSPEVPMPPGLSHVTLDRLLGIMQRALARTSPLPEPARVSRPRVSVRQKIAEIEQALRLNGRLSFAAAIESCCSREEVFAAFFAVLELIKRQRLCAEQNEPFGDILLVATFVQQDDVVAAVEGSERELAGVE